MLGNRCSSLFTMLLLLFSAAAEAEAQELPSLKDLYSASSGGLFVAPSKTDLKQAEKLFALTLGSPVNEEAKELWKRQGFDLVLAQHQGSNYWVLREADGKKTGRGFYVFPEQPGRGNALFMPHRYKDLLTGPIGRKLLTEGSFAVAGWNTVPRETHGKGRKPTWDMARQPDSYFVALTRAFATVHPDAYHIQIHGYDREKRRTPAGKASDVIISNGTRHPTKDLARLKACLVKNGFGRVSLYPVDVQELGATTNISGKTLRAMGNSRFVHLELARGLRTRLQDEKPLRKALLDCLHEALQ